MPIDPAAVPVELAGRRIGLLVGGGIAAYKMADIASQLVAAGCQVRVALTPAASRFVGPATFFGLTGNPVLTDIWSQTGKPEPHVDLGDWAQVLLLAPATANLVARVAAGRADELVTATILAARCPVVVAPAMNDAMWAKPVVQANLARLREIGIAVVPPESGRLASGHTGAGRLPSAAILFEALAGAVRGHYDLAGRRILVSAGGTREAIDPVRYLSNHSSGKMGNAIAIAAADRGAEVVLVTAAEPPGHPGVRVVPVESALDMLGALKSEMTRVDVLVMAAAVADYRPAERMDRKLKRDKMETLVLSLVRNPDLVAELASDAAFAGVFKLGFAAEDHDLEVNAAAKLERKGLDAVFANDISAPGVGMGADDNAGVILFRDGSRVDIERAAKREVAERLLDAIRDRI